MKYTIMTAAAAVELAASGQIDRLSASEEVSHAVIFDATGIDTPQALAEALAHFHSQAAECDSSVHAEDQLVSAVAGMANLARYDIERRALVSEPTSEAVGSHSLPTEDAATSISATQSSVIEESEEDNGTSSTTQQPQRSRKRN